MVKDWSFGGFGAKLVKRKTHTFYPQVKEKKKELRRKEGRSWGEGKRGEGSPHKDFSPKQNHILK
jgi:hypothetical protein